MDIIIKSPDNNNHTQLLLLDLSAAFYTLDQDIQNYRLIEIGIINIALEYIICLEPTYDVRRTFTIKIVNEYSNYNSFIIPNTGFPQGSDLGPLLLIIYIILIYNVIRQFRHVKYHLYADEIILYTELSKYNTEYDNEL